MRIRLLSATLAVFALRAATLGAQQTAGRILVSVPAGDTVQLYSATGAFGIGADAARVRADTVTLSDTANVFFDIAKGDLHLLVHGARGNPVPLRAYDSKSDQLRWTLIASKNVVIGHNGALMKWIPARTTRQ